MRTIQLTDIVIKPKRQRREFDATQLSQLKESIRTKGLMHPIVLENDCKTLVAGERRLRAIKLLYTVLDGYQHDGNLVPVTHVPYITLGDLSPIDLREAELEENTHRADLTWQEKSAALQELHILRSEQRGGQQTYTATATEVLGQSPNNNELSVVREAILLADYLDDKEIASAPTQKEALKQLDKKKKQEHNARLADLFGAGVSTADHKLIQGDLKVELQLLESNIYSCIIVDPPYGVGADSFGSQSFGHNYEDSFESAIDRIRHIAQDGFRIALPQAHMYMFCDITLFAKVSRVIESCGWSVWPRPLIWSKHGGMLPRPEHGPRYTYEAIIFANKGDKPVTAVYSDVIDVAAVAEKEHGAQKPVDVYVDLLRRSCIAGDKIIDPCAGSGTIFPAANKLRLRATGIEKDKANYAIAVRRINE